MPIRLKWDRLGRINGGKILQPLPNVGYSRLAAHQLMLSDNIRVDLFRRAILNVVRKGDVVVDVGTGTGILAFFACQAGARRVYAIEREQIIGLAEQLAIQNGFGSQIEFIHDWSERIVLAESADVLISECLGHAGVGTTQIRSVLDARQRFLRPGGTIIPALLEVILVPVESIMQDYHLQFWDNHPAGLDFSPAAKLARNQMYTVVLKPEAQLSNPQSIYKLDMTSATKYDGFTASNSFCIERSGLMHGLGIWFRATLLSGIVLDTSPHCARTHWYQNFLPFDKCWPVLPGDIFEVKLLHYYEQDISNWEWTIVKVSGEQEYIGAESHGSRQSYPIKPDFRIETKPDLRRSNQQ